jgi:hypothetical protein
VKASPRTLGLALVGALAAHALLTQTYYWFLAQRLYDGPWLADANTEQVRNACDATLRSWFADPHDAFLSISAVGDHDSLRLLDAAIRGHEDDLECTWHHARAAADLLRTRLEN